MKSIILLSSLLFLASCGKEQFGTAAQSESSQADALKAFKQTSCSSFTLIRPKVDILYVVDNSPSTHHIKDDLKSSIKKTLSTISADFDYRVISTPLISTSVNDYHVYTNSSDTIPNTSLIVPRADLLIDRIFENVTAGTERGLQRTIEFMNHNRVTGLLRQGAYHLVIMVSNGRDTEVEIASGTNGETVYVSQTVFAERKASFDQLKSNLASQQFRFFSVTASETYSSSRPYACKEGWLSSQKSYQAMSKALYNDSGASDSPTRDVYDLCGTGFSTLFSGVNDSIQKVLLKHEYRYWPISFADSHETTVDLNSLNVYKVSNGVAQLMNPSTWSYHHNTTGAPLNTRELPTPGEPINGKHFIKFNTRVVYPDCVQITSTTKTEVFGYITIPRKPVESSIIVKINGVAIPKGAVNGWTLMPFVTVPFNIKIPITAVPEVKKSGYMIKLNGSQNYYKSGDSVDVHYIPDAI